MIVTVVVVETRERLVAVLVRTVVDVVFSVDVGVGMERQPQAVVSNEHAKAFKSAGAVAQSRVLGPNCINSRLPSQASIGWCRPANCTGCGATSSRREPYTHRRHGASNITYACTVSVKVTVVGAVTVTTGSAAFVLVVEVVIVVDKVVTPANKSVLVVVLVATTATVTV